MIRKINIIWGVIFLLLSCTPPERENTDNVPSEPPAEERAEKALQDEVIGIHDEVMPKMDNLMRLKMKLQVKIDSLRESNSTEKAKIDELLRLTNRLQKADSAMMTWMRQFKMVRDSVSHEQRMEYLEAEKERIEEVKRKMNESLEEASKFLENNFER